MTTRTSLTDAWRLPLLLILIVTLTSLPRSGGAATAGTCPPLQNTPSFTIVYGTVSVDGTAALAGTVVTAVSPRGDVVGCFPVATAGNYGSMYIYGEDISVNPPVPGMRDGEALRFQVNGATATANPSLYWQDDREPHQVNLTASAAPCIPEDVVPNGQIDVDDLKRVSAAWRHNPADPNYAICDVDGNGAINIRDVQRVGYKWNTTCGGQ